MLSENTKQLIISSYADVKSYRRVAQIFGISKSTVMSVIKKKKSRRMGRPKKFKPRDVRRLKRHIISETRAGRRLTSRSIQRSLGVDCDRRTIQRVLKSNNILYEFHQKKLPLSDVDKTRRLNFARLHIINGTDFSKWIFSDEKRFNLDGPDNLGSYNTSTVKLERVKHQMGGGSIMILGAISSKGHLIIKVRFVPFF